MVVVLEYEFTLVYEHGRTHVVVNVLSILPNSSKALGISNQIMDTSLFLENVYGCKK
jgi:hypothetical protein